MSADENPLVNFFQQLIGPTPSQDEMREMAKNAVLDARVKMAETRRLYEDYRDAEFVNAITNTCEGWIDFVEAGIGSTIVVSDITPDVAVAFAEFHAGVIRWVEAMHGCAKALPKRTGDNDPDKV